MADSLTADLLNLLLQLNRQAYAQPPLDGWLRSVLELLRERFPAVMGVQVVQTIGNAAVIQAASGQVPNLPDDHIVLDAASPVTIALRTRERQIAADLRVYPVVYGDEAIGALIVYAQTVPDVLDDSLSIVAIQLGSALLQQTAMTPAGNPSPTGPLRRQLRLMRSLYEVTRATSSELAIEDVLFQAVKSLVETLNVEYATIQTYDLSGRVIRIAAEYPARGAVGTLLPLNSSQIAMGFVNNPQAPPFILADTQDPKLSPQLAEVIKRVNARSGIFIPMRTRGFLIGSITASTVTDLHVFTPEEVENLQAIAGQLAISIRNAQLFTELERRADQLEQIAELGRRTTSTLDQTAIFRVTASSLKTLLTFDRLSIALHLPGEDDLRLYLIDNDQVLPVVTLPFTQTGLRTVYDTGKPVAIDDISSSDYPDYRLLTRHAPPDGWESGPLMHSALIAPLSVSGRVIGTLNLTREQSGSYSASDMAVITQVSAQLAIALENARLYAQATDRIRTEELRNQLSAALNVGDMSTLVLETTQNIGQAIGARRARVRFNPLEDKE
jgi:GAF domain-containing protein